MKPSRRLIMLLSIALPWAILISYTSSAQPAEEPKLAPDLAAQVGQYQITWKDIAQRIHDVEDPMPTKDKHLQHAYSYLMDFNLLRSQADTLGIKVTEDDRKTITEQQLEQIKKRVAAEYNNALPWDKWLEEQGQSEQSFYAYIYEHSEPIVLKKRVVTYFELTHQSVSYAEIRLGSYQAILKLKEKLDAGEDFEELALLNSMPGTTGVKVAFKSQGLPQSVQKELFEKLEPTKYSSIITINDKDYRIVMLKSRSQPSTKSYAELKDAIEEMATKGGDVTPDRFARWAAVVYNTGKYKVLYRFPGEKVKSASTTPKKDVK